MKNFDEMTNECFRCHKDPYETEPTHWHYCNDCVRVCENCKELKVLWAFEFDFHSATYKEWKAKGAMGFMTSGGHEEICGSCKRAIRAAMETKEPTKVEISQAQLKVMMDALQGRTGSTERPATPSGESQGRLDL